MKCFEGCSLELIWNDEEEKSAAVGVDWVRVEQAFVTDKDQALTEECAVNRVDTGEFFGCPGVVRVMVKKLVDDACVGIILVSEGPVGLAGKL